MSKGFNYSKWDNIELSDDEDDIHPNIDKESWFRMKHRSRVEREDHEDKDKKRINSEVCVTFSFSYHVCGWTWFGCDLDAYFPRRTACANSDYIIISAHK